MKTVALAALCAVLLATGTARASGDKREKGETWTGIAVAMDGDTIAMTQGERVRLASVGAPEMGEWPWGPMARAAMDDLLALGPVTCTATGEESYHRTVASCAAADGRDLGDVLIRAGLATAHRGFTRPKGPDSPPHAYDRAEADARAAGRGVWGR